MDAQPILFNDWEQVLTVTVPAERRQPYREAIVKFRYWLRQTGKTPDDGNVQGAFGLEEVVSGPREMIPREPVKDEAMILNCGTAGVAASAHRTGEQTRARAARVEAGPPVDTPRRA